MLKLTLQLQLLIALFRPSIVDLEENFGAEYGEEQHLRRIGWSKCTGTKLVATEILMTDENFSGAVWSYAIA